MRKLLFFLAVVPILFASCGSDDTPIDDTTYPVVFNISQFTSETESLITTVAWPDKNYCQYVVYKEDGSVVLNKIMDPGTLDVDNLQITVELPKGNYFLAVLSASKTAYNIYTYVPSDYYTDYCNGNSWIAKGFDNYNMYFESIKFTVTDQGAEKTVTLSPMWTEVNIKVPDADVCTLPADTKYIQCAVYPYYYGFSIKDKKATRSMDPVVSAGAISLFRPVASFRSDKGYFDYIAAGSENVTVKLLYLTASPQVSQEIIGEKVVHTGNIEGGKRITYNSNLGSN